MDAIKSFLAQGAANAMTTANIWPGYMIFLE
jgi:hypothetical protein